MERQECEKRAQDVRAEYNPSDLSPFPYQNVEKENEDLDIRFFSFEGDKIQSLSGAIIYDSNTSHFTNSQLLYVIVDISFHADDFSTRCFGGPFRALPTQTPKDNIS